MLEGLRGEESVAELRRREGIAANLHYRWSKDFLEAGKKRLAGDTVREASTVEVKDLKKENMAFVGWWTHSRISLRSSRWVTSMSAGPLSRGLGQPPSHRSRLIRP